MSSVSKKPLISAYTTVRNADSMNYPFIESIKSMLAFADEVVVLDSGDGSDSTSAKLFDLQIENPKLRVIKTDEYDWQAPNHGIFDGMTKAQARSYCRYKYLWQFDTDEIVHEKDTDKINSLIEKLNNNFQVLALPVVEYWGPNGKVRADINPWKARLSLNLPDITHGIPKPLRRQYNGLDYASPGTDTCDYISKRTGEYIPVVGFMPPAIEQLRRASLVNPKLLPDYERWFNSAVEAFPGVFHYSWYSIERKIKQYREFWTDFWKSMYGPDSDQNKDPDWNPFFEVPWREVTDQMIHDKAIELETKTGGHIFHSRWNGKQTPHITIHRDHPKVIKSWLNQQTSIK